MKNSTGQARGIFGILQSSPMHGHRIWHVNIKGISYARTNPTLPRYGTDLLQVDTRSFSSGCNRLRRFRVRHRRRLQQRSRALDLAGHVCSFGNRTRVVLCYAAQKVALVSVNTYER